MAEKIKKFFAKKKADAKFKLAGQGHRLNDSSTTVVGPSKQKPTNAQQHALDAKRQAAEAALARLNLQKKDTAFNTSLAAIQAQVRRELEAEKKNAAAASIAPVRPIETELEASPLLAVRGKENAAVNFHSIMCALGVTYEFFMCRCIFPLSNGQR